MPEGTDDVAVNSLIAVLLGEGENAATISAGPGKTASAPAAAARQSRTGAQARCRASACNDAKSAEAASPAPVKHADGARLVASPLARRLAREKGVDLGAREGFRPQGPHHRPRHRGRANPAPAPVAASTATTAAAMAAPMSDEMILKLFEPGSYELVPHDGMRKIVARRLTESKQTIPHFYLSLDCSLEELLGLREQPQSRRRPRTRTARRVGRSRSTISSSRRSPWR